MKTYGTNLWNKYSDIRIRIRDAGTGANTVVKMFDNYMELENKIAKTLSKFKLRTEKYGYLGDIMSEFQKTYLVNVQTAHIDFQKDVKFIKEELAEKTKLLLKNLKNQNKAEGKIRSVFLAARSYVEKCKQKDKVDGKKWNNAIDKLEKAQHTDEITEKRLRKLKKLELNMKAQSEKSKEAYRDSIEKLKVQTKVYYKDLGATLNELQNCDIERLKNMKKALLDFIDLQISQFEKLKEESLCMKKEINNINPEEYVQDYISKTSSKDKPPNPPAFNPFKIKKLSSSTTGRDYFNKSKQEVDSPLGKVIKKVIVKADYDPTDGLQDGENPDQYLFLKKGDIISVLKINEEGWWLGSLNGKEGYFPKTYIDDYVEEKKIKYPVSSSSMNSGPVDEDDDEDEEYEDEEEGELENLGECVVEHGYKAESESELTLDEGERIIILVKNEDGWWFGKKKNGVTGYFPSNFTDVGRAEM